MQELRNRREVTFDISPSPPYAASVKSYLQSEEAAPRQKLVSKNGRELPRHFFQIDNNQTTSISPSPS